VSASSGEPALLNEIKPSQETLIRMVAILSEALSKYRGKRVVQKTTPDSTLTIWWADDALEALERLAKGNQE
jgi:hypothetical protein